jgi:hypothetical protein
MARRITEVIEADRCSIFLVDREREELWSGETLVLCSDGVIRG